MTSLYEYLHDAKKIIKNKKQHHLLKDEDAIAYVAHFLMLADNRFNGKGDIRGFRYMYASFGLKNYIRKLQKKRKHAALHHNILHNKVQDIIEIEDLSNLLDPLQREIFIKFFIEKWQIKDIAEECNVTSNVVRDRLRKIKRIIQEHYQSIED